MATLDTSTRPSLEKTTLTTLPPELLLSILNHLPTNTFHTLSLVSHSFQAFLHLHAATICNTLITSNPTYLLAATILQAKHCVPDSFESEDEKIQERGWLLPTDRCVHAAETRIIRNKILFSGCRCSSCIQILRSSQSSSTLSLDPESGLGGLFCLPLPGSGRKRDTECKAGRADMMRLSEPGPAFLVFLEKYAWEVVARWEMSGCGSSSTIAATSPVSPMTGHNPIRTDTNPGDEVIEEKVGEREDVRHEEEERFSFMVGNYCIRRFLEDISLNQRHIIDSKTPPTAEPIQAPTEYAIWRRMKSGYGKLQNRYLKGRRKSGERPEWMMFGEIPSDPELVVRQDERPRVESWMRGLAWWYDPTPPLAATTATPVLGEKEKTIAEKKDKERGCMGIIKIGTGRARGKIIQAWAKLGGRRKAFKTGHGEGGFESLDD